MDYHSIFLKDINNPLGIFAGLVNAVLLKWSERSNKCVMKKKANNTETEKTILEYNNGKGRFFGNKIKSRQNVT